MKRLIILLTSGLYLLLSCNKIVIDPLPKVETLPATILDATHVTLHGNVISEGETAVTTRGFCWALTPNPTVDQNFSQNAFGPGAFSETITVVADTTYYIKTFATNANGTTYGNQVEVNSSTILPVLTTAEITEITSRTARGGGNITSDGGISIVARGVCYDTLPNPTIEKAKTNDGNGVGSYTSNLAELLPNRSYYVRAYATNSMGTGYGNERFFPTPMEIPMVITSVVEDINSYSAKVGGVIISAGGGEITEKGVYWSNSPNPTTSGTELTIDGGMASFSQTLLGLTFGETYYVQAFAENSAGVGYGEEVHFTTIMTIDGDFSKWNSIPDFISGEGGTMSKVKLDNDQKYLYIYIEGTENLRGFFDVYIDADNATETGAKTWIYPAGCGADYLIEGFIAVVADADLFQDDPNTTEWGWNLVAGVGSGFVKASVLKTVLGGKAIEFSLNRSMAPLMGKTINIGFIDVCPDWSMQGGLPIIGAQDSKLLQYVFD